MRVSLSSPDNARPEGQTRRLGITLTCATRIGERQAFPCKARVGTAENVSWVKSHMPPHGDCEHQTKPTGLSTVRTPEIACAGEGV